MKRQTSMGFDCPHCMSKCQFITWVHHILLIHLGVDRAARETRVGSCLTVSNEGITYEAFMCTNCNGIIVVRWDHDNIHGGYIYRDHFPCRGGFSPKVDLESIQHEETKNDFKEAIDCYNNGYWKASMIMSRRTIQQELLAGNTESQKGRLKEQIESMDIPQSHKDMLNIIRIYGNHGAHPDFYLYDEDEKPIDAERQEKIARVSLLFLDHHFMDKYEIPKQVANQLKSGKAPSKKHG